MEQGGAAVVWVAEPADTGARSGGEFRLHSGGGEPHRVVAGHTLLGVVVGDPFPGVPGLRADRGGGRQH